MEERNNQRKIFIALALLAAIVAIGISGYIEIEDFGLVDAFYMTMITLTTVGFGEVHPLHQDGKIFTAILSFLSLGFFAYSISVITTFLVEGQLKNMIRGHKIKSIKKMENHVIVVGYGRNGQQVVAELQAYKGPFVVIDKRKDVVQHYEGLPIVFINGDATEDSVLLKAGVDKAHAVISTLPNDADNLFVALTARSLNPKLTIVCRASSESNEKKLKMAGVNSIVMPEKVGGAHMAKLIASPDIVEFLEHLSIRGENPTNLEEIECQHLPAAFINKSINEIEVRKKSGVNIVGFKTPDGTFLINPAPETKVLQGSKLFVLGTQSQINIVKNILKSER